MPIRIIVPGNQTLREEVEEDRGTCSTSLPLIDHHDDDVVDHGEDMRENIMLTC